MGFVQVLKGFYYRAEDKWYDFLDALDRRQLPVYKLIDPIDSVIPSFLLFILTTIFVLVLIAYLLQFYSPVEFTFTAVDSSTRATLSGVAISGVINDENFSKVTADTGEAKLILKGKPANLFEKIGSFFFAEDLEFNAVLSAERSGYHKVENKKFDLASKDATITLTAITLADLNKTFASSTDVELVDNSTGERITDSKGTAYVKYGCSNKGMDQKTSSDGFDGLVDGKFKIIEPNCNFVVNGAYSPGYEPLNGIDVELDPAQTLHTIKLTKSSSPTKGIAKIYVSEKNSSPIVPLVGIQVRLLDLAGNSYEEGTTDFSGVFQKEINPGTYIITATSPDGNYYSIDSGANELIVVTVNSLSEKSIYMQRMDPKLVRFLRIQVIDYNGRNLLKDVRVFPQSLIVNSDNNLTAKGMVGACTNSCRTDANGLITISGLSSQDEGRVIVSLFKDDYIEKVFQPKFFKINSTEFETVELEKANYSENGNGGKGLVLVRAKNDLRPLSPAKAYMYFNSPELNINGISLIQAGIDVNSNGQAIFSGLATREDKVYYASANYAGIIGTSQIKAVEEGKTVLFDVNIESEISFLEVRLIGYNETTIVDKNKAVVKIVPTSAINGPFETLSFDSSTQNFKSKLHDKSREYTLSIDLNNYVPLKENVTLVREGSNLVTKVMYPSNDEILAVFNGLYENLVSNEPATFLDLNNLIDSTTKGYFASTSYVVGKSLKDGNVLGTLKVNEKASITNIPYVTQDYLKKSEIYSCALEEKLPYNDDNYYLPSECVKSSTAQGKQASAIWDGNVEAGVYNIKTKLVFSSNTENGDMLDLNYSGKETDFGFVSEDKNRTTYVIGASICKYSADDSTCPGIFFYSSLNSTSLGSESFDYTPDKKRFSKYNQQSEVEKDLANPLQINIFNNHPVKIDLNLTAYAFASQTMDLFNSNVNGNGSFHFDSNDGVQKKVIASKVSINPFKKSALTDVNLVNIFSSKEKARSYIVIVAELSSGEKYYLFIDAVTQGRNIFLLGGNFLSGVPDQIFNASIINADERAVDLYSVDWKVLGNCSLDNVLKSGTGSINNDVFSMTIPGVYEYDKDCLALRIVAKDEIYRELNLILKAGTGGIDDPELSCASVGIVDSPNNKDVYLQWGNTNKLILTNTCPEEIKLQFESRLILNGVDECPSLLQGEKCTIKIKAQNKDYDVNERFSDVLGVFPVYVKAKLASSKKNYSQVKLVKVHVQNSGDCFAISKDMFDLNKGLAPTSQLEFVINNSCQYTAFGDYFIPKASLKFSGVDLNDAKPKYSYIDLDYNINVKGGTYTLVTNQILRQDIKLNYPALVEEHPSSDAAPLKKYSNFISVIDPTIADPISERMMFRWTDDSANEYYGAKIDGDIKVTYTDGSTKLVTPPINFDFSSGTIACTGSDPAHSSNHCINNGSEVLPDGGVSTMKYGLFYVYYPKGKIKSIELNVLGDPDSSVLTVYTDAFVDYNEPQTVPVSSGETTTNSIASGTFRIYPIEGMTFLLRNYTNPKIKQTVQEKVDLCKYVLTNRAWIGDDKVYYIEKHYNNYDGASRYCNSIDNRLVENNTNKLVESFSSISQVVIGNWVRDSNQFNWMGVGYGFWTNECNADNNTCKVINKTASGLNGAIDMTRTIDMSKYDVDSYAPLCEQDNLNNVSVDEASCLALGVICDKDTGICSESTPELFDSFLAEGYVTIINPSTSVEIIAARTDNGNLDNSTIIIWIDGGILKAMFLGPDYTGYNDESIELNIIDKGVVGDLYGTLNIVDYVNKGH